MSNRPYMKVMNLLILIYTSAIMRLDIKVAILVQHYELARLFSVQSYESAFFHFNYNVIVNCW